TSYILNQLQNKLLTSNNIIDNASDRESVSIISNEISALKSATIKMYHVLREILFLLTFSGSGRGVTSYSTNWRIWEESEDS
ncbi:MAG: hypothetical protein OK457_06300, partial [Thaumarchaeota archaeon]|nr:hypothetical protein [Nitrososphaerota archaeon]